MSNMIARLVTATVQGVVDALEAKFADDLATLNSQMDVDRADRADLRQRIRELDMEVTGLRASAALRTRTSLNSMAGTPTTFTEDSKLIDEMFAETAARHAAPSECAVGICDPDPCDLSRAAEEATLHQCEIPTEVSARVREHGEDTGWTCGTCPAAWVLEVTGDVRQATDSERAYLLAA